MKVVAFHTGGTYHKEARLLARSLHLLKIPYVIEEFAPVRDWDDGVAMKCSFLKEMRARWAGPILYVDVDAVFHRDPSQYFDSIKEDFGAHWFQGPAFGYDRHRNDNWFLSGTLFLNDTPGARKLLDAWHAENLSRMEKGDRTGLGQASLRDVVEKGGDWTIRRLPGEYCYVFDKPWAYPPGTKPVIEHLIASRENRGRSKGKIHRGRRERITQLVKGMQRK